MGQFHDIFYPYVFHDYAFDFEACQGKKLPCVIDTAKSDSTVSLTPWSQGQLCQRHHRITKIKF